MKPDEEQVLREKAEKFDKLMADLREVASSLQHYTSDVAVVAQHYVDKYS